MPNPNSNNTEFDEEDNPPKFIEQPSSENNSS